MKKLILVVCIVQLVEVVLCSNNTSSNSTDPNNDMYVIHATVYQVGILTNKSDDKALNATMGNQEAVTFFRNNGSQVDLSGIPAPLMTNVTAQSVIQVAPKTPGQEQKQQIPWSALKDLASLPQSSTPMKSENGGVRIARSNFVEVGNYDNMENNDDIRQDMPYKRSVSETRLLKREVSEDKASVKVVKGAAVVPAGAGVRSIALPPLLALNNNLSAIPVPIPNTSVVHYAKINTLIRQPGTF